MRSHKLRRGSTLLEFALVLPLMFLMLFVMIDLGRAFWESGKVSDASYLAARASAEAGGAGSDTAGIAFDAVELALAELPGANETARLTVIDGDCTVASPYITVEVSADVPLVSPGLGAVLNIATDNGVTVTSRSTTLCEIVVP